jgi:hypothetical protein
MTDKSTAEEKLPYPTRPLVLANGTTVDEFIIPEEEKKLVLEQLYPFSPIPKLTDVFFDLHADKTFIVKDFRVTWEHDVNYLVSPYYPESGGTVNDWADEEWATGQDDDLFDDSDDEESD